MSWIIPRGGNFTALQNNTLSTFKAEEDLLVLYKGKYLEEEKEWDTKALKVGTEQKNKGLMLGMGALLTLVSGIIGASLKKKPEVKNG
jgi:hypothetical protein